VLFVVIVAPIAFVVLLIRAWPSSPAGDPQPISQKKTNVFSRPIGWSLNFAVAYFAPRG
jgi:hypothetical protein